ncbi:AraC family transcriptional regulator [Acidobacteria bacterium AB60]|nr:AraC family transcriptional regulator [Acidobacteria bacterium AB60]
MTSKRSHQSHFHRSQILRAQRFIRLNLAQPLSLPRIAREARSSSFHFLRLFQAYVGETPFEFIRRLRLATALRLLQEDSEVSVTEIALSVGYETSAAFNKTIRKTLDLAPGGFRNLGKDQQDTLIYDLTQPRRLKEAHVNLTPDFEAVTRPITHYVFLENRGPFAEIAPPLWEELSKYTPRLEQRHIREYLGVSGIDKSSPGEEAMIYQAGIALAEIPGDLPSPLQRRTIKSGRYARFLLTGPYTQIWPAFDHIFKTLAEANVALRPEFCIENYLNDPRTTPEAQLQTELLVPIQ